MSLPIRADERPNIVLILADDLGAHDLACDGSTYHQTPHIDSLAREGLRLTQAYAPAPVCTPTRAALLTGQAPARLQMTIWSEGALNGPQDRPLEQAFSRPSLPRATVTLAGLLQQAGYLTAVVGKWHLGDADHAPETHGFDINIGGTRWGAPATFFFPYRGPGSGAEVRYVPHLELGQPGEYLTDRLTTEALRVIDAAHARRQPLFLWLAHHAPHTPLEAPAADVAVCERRLKPGLTHANPVYAAMIEGIDAGVGRLLQRIEELGESRNTLVIFTSDNGGYLGTDRRQTIPVTSNAPLRSGKGTLYEGGLRVPLLIRWPGVIPAGTTSNQPVVLTDLFPTICQLTGVSSPEGTPGDGLDLTPLLRNPQQHLEERSLGFHDPHYYHAPESTPASALRSGDWKLVEYYEDGRRELFQLADDPGENNDLSTTHPERVAQLAKLLDQWRQQMGARHPRPNSRTSVSPQESIPPVIGAPPFGPKVGNFGPIDAIRQAIPDMPAPDHRG